MKKIIIPLFTVLLITLNSCNQKNEKAMDQGIEKTIIAFNNATAIRDVKSLDKLLHTNYRVTANRFKGTSIIPREVYLNMMEASKIGGTIYELEFIQVNQTDHTASSEIMLTSSSSSDMHKYLFLVQNESNDWQIIGDLPLIVE